MALTAYDKRISERLNWVVTLSGLKQEAVAELVGVDRTTLNRKLSGAVKVSAQELLKICEYVGVESLALLATESIEEVKFLMVGRRHMNAKEGIPVWVEHLKKAYLREFTPEGKILIDDYLRRILELLNTHLKK